MKLLQMGSVKLVNLAAFFLFGFLFLTGPVSPSLYSQDLPEDYNDYYNKDSGNNGKEELPEFLKQEQRQKQEAADKTYFGFKIQPWLGNLNSTEARGDSTFVKGTRFNYDTVGIDRSQLMGYGEAYIAYGRFDSLGMGGYWSDRSNSKTLDQDLCYSGQGVCTGVVTPTTPFKTADSVDSELKIGHLELHYEHALLTPTETKGDFLLLGQLGLAYSYWSLDLHDNTTGTSAREKMWLVMPRFGLHGIKDFSIVNHKQDLRFEFGLFGEVLPGFGNSKGSYIEGYLELSWRIQNHFELGAGWRLLRAHLRNKETAKDTDEARYLLNGPFLNVSVQF